ncbi:MAG: ABC transporter ATP-binding protein [Anaerolineae bacterium]|nr:ABC transporter ATP-binding protein [Anaerolineae bacterium]
MLEVRSLSVWHGGVQAVRRVSLDVAEGEVVALLGANGAGKSSLLSAVAGLQPPSEGQVLLEGREVTGVPACYLARQGLALVPEGRQLAGTMSVRDNLLLGGYHRFARSWRDLLAPLPWVIRQDGVQRKLAEVFELFPRLAERQGQAAQSLSGGEQQMLAIGRALMASPRVMLLDEPSVGLAPDLVRGIFALLSQLRERGLAILLVEQDAYGALAVAQRGYVMETGRIVAEGDSAELLRSESLRRAYLGGV